MKRNLPPLNSLRAFEAAARLGGVGKAAEELNPKRKEHPGKWIETGSANAMHYYGSPIWMTRIAHDMGIMMIELMK